MFRLPFKHKNKWTCRCKSYSEESDNLINFNKIIKGIAVIDLDKIQEPISIYDYMILVIIQIQNIIEKRNEIRNYVRMGDECEELFDKLIQDQWYIDLCDEESLLRNIEFYLNANQCVRVGLTDTDYPLEIQEEGQEDVIIDLIKPNTQTFNFQINEAALLPVDWKTVLVYDIFRKERDYIDDQQIKIFDIIITTLSILILIALLIFIGICAKL